jgi:hypothetical protein
MLDHMFDDQFRLRREFVEQPEQLKKRESSAPAGSMEHLSQKHSEAYTSPSWSLPADSSLHIASGIEFCACGHLTIEGERAMNRAWL